MPNFVQSFIILFNQHEPEPTTSDLLEFLDFAIHISSTQSTK
jgi:hypothetical protein